MPLVFVHGVNVRQGALYDRELAFRNRHFIEVFYKQLGRQVSADSIFNPYWGDLGASPSPDSPYLPRGIYEMLWRRNIGKDAAAGGADIEDIIVSESDHPLLDLAREASLADVIDLLWELADLDLAESGKHSAESERDMAVLAQRALDFCHSPEGEEWLVTVKSDDELLEKLSGLLASTPPATAAAPVEATKPGRGGGIAQLVKSAGSRFRQGIAQAREEMGSRSKSLRVRIKEDVSNIRYRLRQKAVGTTARMFNEPLRAIFHQQCALLIGDAFSYFGARGDQETAAPIAKRVINSLSEAVEFKRQSKDELIVVGHSMGGVILCDIVTQYAKDIPIDILITVGSQFPLFADLQMFPGINHSERPIPKPANVNRWINIFDPHDFLGYPASHLFKGIDDYHLPTYALGASAHTNYFNRRSFYFQLARRLSDCVALRPG